MSQVRLFDLNDRDDGMASNTNTSSWETEHNNTLQFSERDTKLMDDQRGMEDKERIREIELNLARGMGRGGTDF